MFLKDPYLDFYSSKLFISWCSNRLPALHALKLKMKYFLATPHISMDFLLHEWGTTPYVLIIYPDHA